MNENDKKNKFIWHKVNLEKKRLKLRQKLEKERINELDIESKNQIVEERHKESLVRK